MKAERNFEGVVLEPSLANLSTILRNRELWPRGFRWYYGDCETCAMGLAVKLWHGMISYHSSWRIADAFDMDFEQAGLIFGGNHNCRIYDGANYPDITPEMVADKIDEYLAGAK